MRRNLILARFLSAASLMLATGCATVSVEEEPSRTTLITARAGTEVTLQWESEEGVTYTVMYADKMSGSAKWAPVPGLESIRGTGGTLTHKDTVPEHIQRYYRLNTAR